MPVNQEAFVLLLEPDPAQPTFAASNLWNIQEQVSEPLGGFVAHNRCIKVVAQQGGEGLAGTFRWSRNEKRALWPFGGWHRELASHPQLRWWHLSTTNLHP